MVSALLLEDHEKARYLEEIVFLCAWLHGEEKQIAVDLAEALARGEGGREAGDGLAEVRLRVWPTQAAVVLWAKEDLRRIWPTLLSLVLPSTRILLLRLAKQLDTEDIAAIWRAPQTHTALFQRERAEIEALWPWMLARAWEVERSVFALNPKEEEKAMSALAKRFKKQPLQVEAEMQAMVQLKNALT